MEAPASPITAHLPSAATIPVKMEIEDHEERTATEEEGNDSKIQTNKKGSEINIVLPQGRKRRADGDDNELPHLRIKTEPVEAEADMSGIPPKYRQQFEEWQSKLKDSSNIMKEIMASGMDLTTLMDHFTEEQKDDARKYVRIHRLLS